MYKSRRKISIIIVVCAVFLVALLGGLFYIKEYYTIQTVYVEGNVHYT